MNFLKKLMPEWLLKTARPVYHGLLAILAAVYYAHPSRRLIVVGVTGTAGKSTTVQMLARILNSSSRKCGYITTAGAYDGNYQINNQDGLSMPGGPTLQKMLKSMLSNGCSYGVIECTSEGLRQNRHLGIDFDAALVTNLSEAHIDAHGSFEMYQKSKGKLLQALSKASKKPILPKKIIGANLDDTFADYFLNFAVDEKFTISLLNKSLPNVKDYPVRQLAAEPFQKFEILGTAFELHMLGPFNVYNAALAAACADMLGVPLAESSRSLRTFRFVPGRMQEIPTGKHFRVFVDYAPEPAGMRQALQAVSALPHGRIIHVFGATGGHRDKAKGFEFGKISAQYSNVIIITNDDVYDSDPDEIARGIELGIRNQELWKGSRETILDRKEAIRRALSIAQKDDIVIFTGKGNEKFLVLPGDKRVEWDEEKIIQDQLAKI